MRKRIVSVLGIVAMAGCLAGCSLMGPAEALGMPKKPPGIKLSKSWFGETLTVDSDLDGEVTVDHNPDGTLHIAGKLKSAASPVIKENFAGALELAKAGVYGVYAEAHKEEHKETMAAITSMTHDLASVAGIAAGRMGGAGSAASGNGGMLGGNVVGLAEEGVKFWMGLPPDKQTAYIGEVRQLLSQLTGSPTGQPKGTP